jgi:hypothetical protein
VFETASPGPSNGGKSRPRDQDRRASVRQGCLTLKDPVRNGYGIAICLATVSSQTTSNTKHHARMLTTNWPEEWHDRKPMVRLDSSVASICR